MKPTDGQKLGDAFVEGLNESLAKAARAVPRLRRSSVVLESTAERIKRHLDAGTITGKEHEALHLHEVKGLSYRTISYGLGLSVSAVRDRVKRGEFKMRANDRKAA